MANGAGTPGIGSKWDGGDLVFFVRSTGAEVLRLATDGSATTGGLMITGGTGDSGDVLTSNGDGTASFAPPAPPAE